MSDAAITTVIPTFRRPKLLKRAIESVLAQSFTGFKVCVYDNASGDETEQVVRGYASTDARIHYIRNSENIGAVNNMIRGVEAVSTPFYSLLNDDDMILPDFYAHAMDGFAAHPEAGFACAKSIILDLIGRKIHLRNRDWTAGLYQPSAETVAKMYRSHFTQTGVVLRREMRDRIGPFDTSGNDILYLTLAAASVPFVVADSYDAVFLFHQASYSATGGIAGEERAKLQAAMLESLGSVLKLDTADDIKVHLVALISKSYFDMFDDKALAELKSGAPGATARPQPLPSRITAAGLLNHTYGAVPSRLHRLVTLGIDAAASIENINRARKKRRRPGANIEHLPSDLEQFFRDANGDTATATTRLQAVIHAKLADRPI